MIYDYANQYWDHLFNDGPAPERTDRKVTLQQHLAWPETRIGHLMSWIVRPGPGWDKTDLCQLMYERLADIEDGESHY